jgi:hypothetical protein
MNSIDTTKIVLETIYEGRHGSLSYKADSHTLLCSLHAGYVPMAEFRILLEKAGIAIKEKTITKFIFDKRKLTVFHQPSMEWYHIYWKEEMYRFGLTSHRKLIPDDALFKESIDIGRRKILKENPSFDYSKYDIIYCKTLEEAFRQ